MAQHRILTALCLIPWIFGLCACSALNGVLQADSQVEVHETQSRTTASTEVIKINNCGGKGESRQVSERTLAVAIEGSFGANVGYALIQGSVSEKYSQFKSTTKRHEMTAPPGTNMEFSLKWTEQEWTGTVSTGGKSGSYTVHAPLSVEQVFSRDLGDCAGSSQTGAQPANAPAKPTSTPPAPAPTATSKPAPALTATPAITLFDKNATVTVDGLQIYLEKVDIQTDEVVANVVLKNNTGSKLLFRFDTQSYYGVDNLGNVSRTYIWDCSSTLQQVLYGGCGDVSMPAGDTLVIHLTMAGLKLTNDQVKEVTLVIRQLSRAKDFGFRIPIPH